MKKIIPILTVALLALSTACSGGSKSNDSTTSENDTIANDTAVGSHNPSTRFAENLKGDHLSHSDSWKIGNLKGIEVQANKISCENESLGWISLCKDCGDKYYFILQNQLPSLYEAINTIKSNLNRETDHHEKYRYMTGTGTQNDVGIVAETFGKEWKLYLILRVDSTKSDTYIALTPAELDKLVVLLQLANNKLNETM